MKTLFFRKEKLDDENLESNAKKILEKNPNVNLISSLNVEIFLNKKEDFIKYITIPKRKFVTAHVFLIFNRTAGHWSTAFLFDGYNHQNHCFVHYDSYYETNLDLFRQLDSKLREIYFIKDTTRTIEHPPLFDFIYQQEMWECGYYVLYFIKKNFGTTMMNYSFDKISYPNEINFEEIKKTLF